MTNNKLSKGAGIACALGWFDGLHLGHMALVSSALCIAEEENLSSAVWTIGGSKSGSASLLLTEEEKAAFLRTRGVTTVITADFGTVCDLSPEEFIRDVLIARYGTRIAVCGFNYRFGKGGSGDASDLSALMDRFGGRAVIIPPVRIGNETVSSTRIREYLKSGEPENAARMLGRPYSLTSATVHGRRVGHLIGFPTVNQTFGTLLVPRPGVYATEVTADGRKYPAVSNVGVRPTFDDGNGVICESHILSGFTDECYNKTVKTEFLHFLRPEMRFSSADGLAERISMDVAEANDYFSGRRQA